MDLLIIGSLPLIIIGYIFYNYNFYENLRTLHVIAWSTLIFGVALYFQINSSQKNHLKKISVLKMLL